MSPDRMKPAVSKYWLIALAGLLWTIVGIILCRMALAWLSAVHWQLALPLGLLAMISSVTAWRFGFNGIARKNIDRLCLLPDKCCIFAFQAWKNYLVIVFMIMLGIVMRHSPLPKHFLAVIYATIGGALFLSSFQYYRRLWLTKILKQPCLLSDKK